MDAWERSKADPARGPDPRFLKETREALADVREVLGLDDHRVAELERAREEMARTAGVVFDVDLGPPPPGPEDVEDDEDPGRRVAG